MPLPQQQPAFVPVQLCCKPALSCSFHHLQSVVKLGQGLSNLPRSLTCHGKEGYVIGHPRLRPGGTISGQTAAQDSHSLPHIAIPDLDPPEIDHSRCVVQREPLLCRHRNQLVCPLLQGCVFSGEQEQQGVV